MGDLFEVICLGCVAVCYLCEPCLKCCEVCCCCESSASSIDKLYQIESSDLKIIVPQHLENTVFLMTEKNRAELEKRSSLYTFDAEALDAIPPSERIMITDLPQDPEGTTPDKVGDTKYNAIKALLKGINDIEARELFGGDRVSYKGLESQGITSAEQLRTRNGKLTHET